MDYCDNQTEHDKLANNEELHLYCHGKPMEARKVILNLFQTMLPRYPEIKKCA